MTTTLSSKGQIVLPADLRREDRIGPGQSFVIERVKAGRYVLQRVASPDSVGTVAWLLSCPTQDWFRPVPSESTDAL